uniref:Trafficking kinesin-binding protein 1 n=1 Tax=Schistocephalus solidus TaxID=70667 RepID=A0A0V0J3W1_SCHSO
MQGDERDVDEDSSLRDTPAPADFRLSDEQMDCAFDYFLLFDRNKNKMDLPLDDHETMARLIHEKQSDLELAAEIGKTLLDRNRELDYQLKERERQMASATEKINQLQHTLGIKEELLHMWTQSLDAHENSPCPSTFDLSQGSTRDHPPDTSAGTSGNFRRDEIDFIHRKIQALEEENLNLRNERTGEQGASLRECMRKLADAVVYIRNLSDEQSKRSDALIQQQHQLNHLMRRSQELENNLNQVGITNEMLASKVDELKTINQHLNKELRDMKDKYDESLALYAQAQANVRQLRRRAQGASLNNSSLLYSPSQLHTNNNSFNVSVPVAVRPISIAEELIQSVQQQQQQQQSGAAFVKTPLEATNPVTRGERSPAAVTCACADTDNGANLGPLSGQREVDCMWDDATIASSGFVSYSEPLENAVVTTRQPSSPWRRRAEVLQDSRRVALSRGLVWEENLEEIDDSVFEEDDDGGVNGSPVSFGPSSPQTKAQDLAQQLQNLQLEKPSAFRIQQRSQRDAPPPSTSQSFESSAGCTFRRSLILEPGTIDALAKAFERPQSETYDTDRRKTHDDSSIDSRTPTVHSMSYIAPQRLQLIKQIEGSGILHRWQKLATPSITSALFESPLTGVLSRTSSATGASGHTKNTDTFSKNIAPHPSSQSAFLTRQTRARSCEIPNTECGSGSGDSTLPASSNISFGRGTPPVDMDILPGAFTPMLSTVLAAGIGPTVKPAPQLPAFSTESILSQYLSSQRGRQFRPPAGYCTPDRSTAGASNVVAGPAHCTNSFCLQQQRKLCSSPVQEEGIISTRSLSPVCRGLLDVSELAVGGAAGVDPIGVDVPPLRPMSSVGATNSTTPSRPRRSNLAMGPTLNSVQEETGFLLGPDSTG